jgi:hypothetical protein
MYRLLFLGLLISAPAFAQYHPDDYPETYSEQVLREYREDARITEAVRAARPTMYERLELESTYRAEQAENRLNANTHAPGGYIPNDEYNDYLELLDSQ